MSEGERGSCPMSAVEVIDRAYLENRARLVEVAAFLDRIDRCADAEAGRGDLRYRALRRALEGLLAGPEGARADALLDALSDPTPEPLMSAAGLPPARGAWGEEGS